MKTSHRLSLIASAAALSASFSAHAVVNGIAPSMAAGAPAIVNPFTGQATDAWKTVGFLGCSAFQISREWVIQAGHCGLRADLTSTFTGHLGTSTVLGSDCFRNGQDDFQLCRLKNPENMTPLANYPAMVALPTTWRNDRKNAIKYGSMMGYGHAAAGDGLAFTGLDGFPAALDAAAPNLTPYPFTSGGDSGGAAYWFPPASVNGYMVGVLVVAGGVPNSPFYFREDNLSWIKDIIQARGDVPPSMPGIANVFSPSANNPAPALAAAPAIIRVGNTNSVTLTWSTPSATPAVSNFKVSVGRSGAIENTFNVAPTASNQTTLNLSAVKGYTLCVRPHNALGAASPLDQFQTDAKGLFTSYATNNCVTLDNRDNLASITGLASTGNKPVSSQISVGFGWGSVAQPSDLAITGYRLTQTISYGTGPSRTTTATVSTPSTAVIVPKGSKVCLAVAAIASNSKVGPTSAQVCTLAN